MPSQGRNRTDTGLLRFLAVHRMVAYIGGLLVIVSPTLLEKSGTAVPSTARTLLVLVSLALMIATYVGERRFGTGRSGGSEASDDAANSPATASSAYSRRTRLLFTLALAGFAIGVYVAVEVSEVAGIAFVVGAYLFGYFTFHGDDDGI